MQHPLAQVNFDVAYPAVSPAVLNLADQRKITIKIHMQRHTPQNSHSKHSRSQLYLHALQQLIQVKTNEEHVHETLKCAPAVCYVHSNLP